MSVFWSIYRASRFRRPRLPLADVKDYLGVRPDQVIDYKALVGDTSDNIPGVTGIGEKTAITLLEKYDTLDALYAHLADLSDSVRKKLKPGAVMPTSATS